MNLLRDWLREYRLLRAEPSCGAVYQILCGRHMPRPVYTATEVAVLVNAAWAVWRQGFRVERCAPGHRVLVCPTRPWNTWLFAVAQALDNALYLAAQRRAGACREAA